MPLGWLALSTADKPNLAKLVPAIMFAVLAVTPSTLAAGSPPVLDWAYPAPPRPGAMPVDDDPTRLVGLKGSNVRLPESAFYKLGDALDWHPDRSAGAPDIVLHGRKDVPACGACHLPEGGGRPENAALAGLPADYISRQVASFRNGSRTSANPDWGPTRTMAGIASAADPAEVAAAARWFSGRRFTSHLHVIETDRAPHATGVSGLYEFDPAATELLGKRILEGPIDLNRHAKRDPDAPYVAYVPEGAVARGASTLR